MKRSLIQCWKILLFSFMFAICVLLIDIQFFDSSTIFIPIFNIAADKVFEHSYNYPLTLHKEFNLDDLWTRFMARSLKEKLNVYSIMKNDLSEPNSKCYDILYNKYKMIDKNEKYNKMNINESSRYRKTKIIDVTFYAFEIDTLEIRLNELSQSVDIFVLVESTLSWNGKIRRDIDQLNLINDLKNKKPHLYKEYYLTKKIYHYILDPPDSYKGTGRHYAYSHEFDFLESKEFRQFIDFQLHSHDLIALGDLDEIPRGMFLFLLKECDGWINKGKYFPITIDSMFFKYDFGCEIEYTLIRKFQYLNKNFIWRHGGLIRYGQIAPSSKHPQFTKLESVMDNLNLKSYNITTSKQLTDHDEKNVEKLSKYVCTLANLFNDGQLLSPRWFRPSHEARHNDAWEQLSSKLSRKFQKLEIELKLLKKQCANNNDLINLIKRMNNCINQFEDSRKQIILVNGGWHLSWFFTNHSFTHKILGLQGDTWKNSEYNHDNLECFIKDCIHLNKKDYGRRHWFNINKNKSYLSVKYPQWPAQQAIANHHSTYFKLFPTKNTTFLC